MSDWDVQLVFQDDKSNKFWRARAEGTDLTVNYGRIGSDGQTQVKSFGSAEQCAKELDQLQRSKRRKGYVDDSSAGPKKEPEVEFAKASYGPRSVDMVLEMDKRKVNVRLSVDGQTVRTEVVEHYGDTSSAESAFDRLKAAMVDEGYRI